MTRHDIETIVDLINEGKTFDEVADELNYAGATVIGRRLSNSKYTKNKKASLNGNQLLLSLDSGLFKNLGLDPEEENIYFRAYAEDGEIRIKPFTDRVIKVEDE